MMAQKKSPEGIQYSGFFDALIKIPRQEGIMAMYKVCSSPILHWGRPRVGLDTVC
jgi:hypothetical protein